MEHLLALSIGGTPILAPPEIPTGGLPKAFDIGSSLLTFVYLAIILMTLGYLIWGGVKWITSGGDKTKVDGARKTIIYALIGLIFIFLSFLIINVVTTIFGVTSPSSLQP